MNAHSEVAHPGAPPSGAADHDSTNAYQSLSETVGHDDPRWAFGTGVEDVQTEIVAPVPEGLDGADLAAYCLMLGDDALIYSHRLAEWVTIAPELEEEVALANIALDLLGQARLLLARAGHVEGRRRDEDDLAFWRSEGEFLNIALAEIDDGGDFAHAIARLLVFSTWRLALLTRLLDSRDPVLAAVAGKGVKEITYHRDYAAQWLVRLGDGTAESHARAQAAVDAVWPYIDELFRTCDQERRLVEVSVGVDPAVVREEVETVLDAVLDRATLTRPTAAPVGRLGGRSGRQGVHTEHLGHVLAELQSLARQHPGARW